MKTNRVIIGVIFVLAILVVIFVVTRTGPKSLEPLNRAGNPPPQPSPSAAAAPGQPNPVPTQLQSVAASSATAKSVRQFASMGVLERNAQLQDIKKQDLASIFHLWQDANRVDKDLMKQGAIATAFTYELRRRTPSPELLEEMRRYVADGVNSLRERISVIGMFSGAATKESVNFLLQVASAPECNDLKQFTIQGIAAIGEHSGGGSFHEDISPALESAWHESRDPDLLNATAASMAEVGAPRAIESLLVAALDDNDKDDARKLAAKSALARVYTANAVPPVAVLLAAQPSSSSSASTLAGSILVGIGDATAAKALLGWLQNADASAAVPVRDFVARTRTPALLKAWNDALDAKVSFRSESVRSAIRTAMAEYHQNYKK